jgi:lipase chaperone LimK
MKIIDYVNWTEEDLEKLMREYVAKADNTSNSYSDRDVFRQLYYHYKSLLMKMKDENN